MWYTRCKVLFLLYTLCVLYYTEWYLCHKLQGKVRVLCQWVYYMAGWTGLSILWKQWASIQKVPLSSIYYDSQ